MLTNDGHSEWPSGPSPIGRPGMPPKPIEYSWNHSPLRSPLEYVPEYMKCGEEEKPAAFSRLGLVWPSRPPNRSKTRPIPWLRAFSAAG